MLEITDLSKRFGERRALDGVSLQVPAGQMLGIIGRSGAGKSTLLRIINRLAEPTTGTIQFDGKDIRALRGRSLRAWRTGAAMIFQQFNLAGRLDVLTNVLVGRVHVTPLWRAAIKAFTQEDVTLALAALERVDLMDQAFQRAETLSGGQQQRVAIARALVQRPHLILADEPIASLDPANADAVMATLRAINRQDGIIVIANLHDLDYARAFCDRIIGMAAGRIVFDGAPSALDAQAETRIYGGG